MCQDLAVAFHQTAEIHSAARESVGEQMIRYALILQSFKRQYCVSRMQAGTLLNKYVFHLNLKIEGVFVSQVLIGRTFHSWELCSKINK